MFQFIHNQQRLYKLLRCAKKLNISSDARLRLQWFAFYVDHERNVSLTCRHFGIARTTFIRWAKRFNPLEPETLDAHSRKPKHVRQPETDEVTVHLIAACRKNSPFITREEISHSIKESHGISLSTATIGRVIQRYGLFFAQTVAHKRKRREMASHKKINTTESLNALSVSPQNSGFWNGMSAALPALLLLITGALAATVHIAPAAYAADSDDFTVNENNQHAGAGDAESESFQLEGTSITWSESDAESDDFSTGTSDTDDDTDDDTESGSSGGGSGGSADDDSTVSGGGTRLDRSIDQEVNEPAPSEAEENVYPSARQRVTDETIGKWKLSPPPQNNTQVNVNGTKKFLTAPQYSGVVDASSIAPPDCNPIAIHSDISQETQPSVKADTGYVAQFMVLISILISFVAGYIVNGTRRWVPISRYLASKRLNAAGNHGEFCTRLLVQKVVTAKKVRTSPKKKTRSVKIVAILMWCLLCSSGIAAAEKVYAIQTVPQNIIYTGQLKTKTGTAITTAHQLRFSFWSDADAVPLDLLGDGTIDVTRPNYAGWQEIHTVTPSSSGNFAITLGSGTALPSLANMTQAELINLHMQVEVKPAGQPVSAFQIMDVNSSPIIDRTAVRSVPFALNSDLLDQHDTGTGSGNIAVLGSGGLFNIGRIPGGTNASDFTIDADDTVNGTIALKFGSSLGKALAYDEIAGRFTFNDDVRIEGDLTVTGLINGIDIDTLLAPAETSALKVSTGAGLNLNVSNGSYRLNDEVTNHPGASNVGVTNNATSFLYFGSGGLSVSTVGFPDDESAIPLAQVVASGGSISQVTDRRVLQSDDRERSIAERYSAGFEHVVFQGDTVSNVGQLSVSHDATNKKNYYQWTSSRDGIQDYDIIVHMPLSEDFMEWMDNPLEVQYRSTSADSANAKIDISVFDTNGSPVTLSGSVMGLASTTWATSQIDFAKGLTWTPGTEFLIKIKVSAKSNFQVHLAGLLLRYKEFAQ